MSTELHDTITEKLSFNVRLILGGDFSNLRAATAAEPVLEHGHAVSIERGIAVGLLRALQPLPSLGGDGWFLVAVLAVSRFELADLVQFVLFGLCPFFFGLCAGCV